MLSVVNSLGSLNVNSGVGQGGYRGGREAGGGVTVFSKWIPKKTGSSAHKGYFCLDYVGPALNHLGFMILGK